MPALALLVFLGAVSPAARAAAADEVPGRLVLELTDAAARALRAGTLDLPIPVGGRRWSRTWSRCSGMPPRGFAATPFSPSMPGASPIRAA